MTGHPPEVLEAPLHRSIPPRQTVPSPGSWRYVGTPHSHRTLTVAIVVSASLHALMLLGFNHHHKAARHVVVDDAVTVRLVMPDLKDLEEPDKTVHDDNAPPDAGLMVPTLADVPSQVDLSAVFVQQIDFSSLVPKQNLTAAKTLSIPTHINRTGRIGEGIKIFDLKDLDRRPEPIVKIAPMFPSGLKQAGMQADVTVEFVVTPEGEVMDAFVAQSTDHRFDDAAVFAINKWKFRPGIKSGHRVNVRVQQPFPFRVTDSD